MLFILLGCTSISSWEMVSPPLDTEGIFVGSEELTVSGHMILGSRDLGSDHSVVGKHLKKGS